ncbi:hypothetical protein Nepgr_023748 [Nepenthes gracilis]|uniref:Mitochondrial import inner membrane translocase subunit TIM50 n=1 Tax=Nepenthes gracilis TaxID=150966 RepID=A0AAD3T1Z0_NEPGR|nr:hypothetical protein Nepgr_023748 [Nepenthes gracilis]
MKSYMEQIIAETSLSLERKNKKQKRHNITADSDSYCDPGDIVSCNTTWVERDSSLKPVVNSCAEIYEVPPCSAEGSLSSEKKLDNVQSYSVVEKLSDHQSCPNAVDVEHTNHALVAAESDPRSLCRSSEICGGLHDVNGHDNAEGDANSSTEFGMKTYQRSRRNKESKTESNQGLKTYDRRRNHLESNLNPTPERDMYSSMSVLQNSSVGETLSYCPEMAVMSGFLENMVPGEDHSLKVASADDDLNEHIEQTSGLIANDMQGFLPHSFLAENGFDKPTTCHKDDKTLDDASVVDKSLLSVDMIVELPVCSVDDGTLVTSNKDDNSVQMPQMLSLLGPSSTTAAENSRKKLLILDLNGILADIIVHFSDGYMPDTTISGKAVFKRPFCDDFMEFCFERFCVGIWSSRTKRNVDGVVDFLMGEGKRKLLFCWNQFHCTDTGYFTVENKNKPLVLKELKNLWNKQEPDLPWEKGEYNESNTLLIDDSPYKALRNPPHTAIFPLPYRYHDVKDNSLGAGGDLRAYLEQVSAAENVQKFVMENPFGQRPITKSNLSWPFYAKIVGADAIEQHADVVNPSASL